jgi:hypothetical protein
MAVGVVMIAFIVGLWFVPDFFTMFRAVSVIVCVGYMGCSGMVVVRRRCREG